MANVVLGMSSLEKTTTSQGLCRYESGWQTPAEPSHEHTAALFEYWKSKCGDAPMPHRSAIDPIDMPQLLPMISLLEVVRGKSLRFKVRLFGTFVVDIVGEDRTGRYLDDFGDDLGTTVRQEIVARWHQTCQAVYDTRTPQFVTASRITPQKEHQNIHAAALPLTKSVGSVDFILGLLTTDSAVSSSYL
jgi:hypothetical protein